ncbi:MULTISPECIES: sulfur carrier protein ThiS [Janthinobacterium]|uniref:Thiamine biosynthesis protein ThiS n=2 Tax=Janthinobacterium TaxID=29580 RepID=A0A1S1U3M8_9BURK|nr:thiamine biosynthesis protein ThiS [Janthinobacterium sp. LM6]KAB8047616.1 sulfur carrier protein ThiS [Janthinobacterium sp. FT68W]OHV94748.1 thiamine biosynthesis protein ThiS [Janthinobacterium lividum]PHV15555.1 thiamine biosynthesis protein ThiS [Janthinobacterium sp. BJB303]PHV25797.1 thiamine biosynthesis protein ThiS [Janthinobacterium sp. BJB426]PHV31502.1 thiamine biosynthesis protein ThiS [Janthinobacterium sp. BJB312]PJC97699.1 thiamine biosynthesis protein ThiS [Janthinobacter
MISITLNGAPHQVPPGQTLDQLIAALSLENQALALAVNRNVVPRKAWPGQVLQVQDQVEIVRAIGGG